MSDQMFLTLFLGSWWLQEIEQGSHSAVLANRAQLIVMWRPIKVLLSVSYALVHF